MRNYPIDDVLTPVIFVLTPFNENRIVSGYSVNSFLMIRSTSLQDLVLKNAVNVINELIVQSNRTVASQSAFKI